jgi:hypothetical protein
MCIYIYKMRVCGYLKQKIYEVGFFFLFLLPSLIPVLQKSWWAKNVLAGSENFAVQTCTLFHTLKWSVWTQVVIQVCDQAVEEWLFTEDNKFLQMCMLPIKDAWLIFDMKIFCV